MSLFSEGYFDILFNKQKFKGPAESEEKIPEESEDKIPDESEVRSGFFGFLNFPIQLPFELEQEKNDESETVDPDPEPINPDLERMFRRLDEAIARENVEKVILEALGRGREIDEKYRKWYETEAKKNEKFLADRNIQRVPYAWLDEQNQEDERQVKPFDPCAGPARKLEKIELGSEYEQQMVRQCHNFCTFHDFPFSTFSEIAKEVGQEVIGGGKGGADKWWRRSVSLLVDKVEKEENYIASLNVPDPKPNDLYTGQRRGLAWKIVDGSEARATAENVGQEVNDGDRGSVDRWWRWQIAEEEKEKKRLAELQNNPKCLVCGDDFFCENYMVEHRKKYLTCYACERRLVRTNYRHACKNNRGKYGTCNVCIVRQLKYGEIVLSSRGFEYFDKK